jgi:DNA-binding beta-propeller fold protein YncE
MALMVSAMWARRIVAGVVSFLLLGAVRSARAQDPAFQGLVQALNTSDISLSTPSGLVVDSSGDIYVADTGHSQIVEVTARGVASVLTINGVSPALSAPAGVALDGAGNLYIADTGNNRVVRVTSAGVASIVSMGSVILSAPKGVALDQAGDLFVADTGNNRIVEVTAGGAAAALSITGLSSPSALNTPLGLAVDVTGKLYIADSANSRIVEVAAGSTTGSVLSIAGDVVTLAAPSSVAVDGVGNVYIADSSSNSIAEVDAAGNGTLLLDTAQLESVTLSGPSGVAVDAMGTVYVSDTGNNRSLIVDPQLDGDSSTSFYSSTANKSAVGFGHVPLGSSSAVSQTLTFNAGTGGLGAVKVFTSGAQNLDFQANSDGTTCSGTTSADATCSVEVNFLPTAPGLRVGAVVLYDTSQNPILTLPIYGYGDAPVAVLSPNTGSVIGTGGVTTQFPFQLALDGAGNMYVGDYVQSGSNPKVVKILAGGGSASAVSTGSVTLGPSITGVALDGAGNLFIADYDNDRIVVVTPGGVASVLSISGLNPALGQPTELAFDAAGNLYIADYAPNARIVKISSLQVSGSTSSGAGTVVNTGSYTFQDSTVTGVAVGPNGTVYIAARAANNNQVIQVTATGVASALTATGLTFSNPQGAAVDAMGNVYVEDSGNSRIVRITTAGVASVVRVAVQPSPSTVSSGFGVTVDPFGNLYIPDWGNNRIVFVNSSGAAMSYASTMQGETSSDSPQTATVTNLGNQPLVFSANPTYTANFSSNGNDANPCISSMSLSAGTVCDVSVNFTPQSVGSLSAGITVTDNTLKVAGSTQQVSVTGSGLTPGDTTSTAVTISPSSLVAGQPASITATVSDTAAEHTSPYATSGSVTFSDSVVGPLNGGAPVALSGTGTAVLTGVVLGVGPHTITANYTGSTGNYLASSGSTGSFNLGKDSVTVTGPAMQPVSVTAGQTGSATITVTAPYTTIAAPSGTLSYSILNASGSSAAVGTAMVTAGSGSSTATVTIPGSLAAGSYTISVTYSGDSNYLASSAASAVAVQVSQITPTIRWNPGVTSIAYGTALGGSLNASAQSGSTPVAGTFSYTATIAGGAAVPVTAASVLAAGSYTLTATFSATNSTEFARATAQVPLSVTQVSSTVTLTSNASSVLLSNPVTFTATVTSPVSTPTGTVNFLDGTTPLGQAVLVGGVATLSSSSLVVGTHTITAIYGGDNNFAGTLSGALTEAVLDFSLSNAGGSGSSNASQTVTPGGTVSYPLNILPSSGTLFPTPITLSVTGLPGGMTASVAPATWTQLASTTWYFPANTPLPTATLTIQTPSSTASLRREGLPYGHLPRVLLSLLLLPFVGGWRRVGKGLGRTLSVIALLVVGSAALAGLSGCSSGGGFFAQQTQSYTVTVTATSGTLSHSTTVTFTVE